MKVPEWSRPFICLTVIAIAVAVSQAALIPLVPDNQQPPAGSLGNPTHNACAPVSATNISEYWDVVMGHPNATMVNAGLPGTIVADYYYYFMDASNWGSPVRANGTSLPPALGTYNVDIMPGFYEYVRWDALHPFTTPPPPLPPAKIGYDWFFTADFGAGFTFHQAQIDSGQPDIVCFTYWNPLPTGFSILEPGFGPVDFFLWGPPVSSSGPPNPVENWNHNPNPPENIGHAVTGVGYYANFDPDGPGPLPLTNWIVCHDNWPTTPVNVAIPWANWTATFGVNPGQIVHPDSLYWKDFNGDAPGGYMPDFDQKQDFTGDGIPDQGYCGPASVANSLWWFQGKYPNRTIIPPAFYPNNPIGFIQLLAGLMKTNHSGNPAFPPNGTYIDSMQAGIEQYLQMMQINDLLYEHTIRRPTFDTIEAEIERCQDVTLLIGIWVIREVIPMPPGWLVVWTRTGGHYVTAAGVNSLRKLIGVSDPYYDNFEGGICNGVLRGTNHNHPQGHNDGVSASHDIYNINDTLVYSPGGLWELDHPFWHSPGLSYEFRGQNEDTLQIMLPWPWPQPPVVGAVYSEIEAAVIVSPYEGIPDINVRPDTLDYAQPINTIQIYPDQIEICNTGTAPLRLDSVLCDLSWVTTNFVPHLLAPGACDTLDVTVNTTHPPVNPGTYLGVFHVYSNDPDESVVDKPYIQVAVLAPSIVVRPDSLYHQQPANAIRTYPNEITVKNTGTHRGRYNFLECFPCLNVYPDSGSVPPGDSVLLTLEINTTGMVPGVYYDSNMVITDDPVNPVIYRPKIALEVTPPVVESLYWKDYNGPFADGGYMPDFDQKQDFNGDGFPEMAYCGPVAVANSFWWFQGKYPEKTIVPPPFYPANPLGFVQMLATMMKTNSPLLFPGTHVDSMQSGIRAYLNLMHLDSLLYEHTIYYPTFDTIEAEIERCQDVVLLVGFWKILWAQEVEPGMWIVGWRRIGGHYFTAAGVNSMQRLIGLSDPYFDNTEAGITLGVIRGTNHVHPGGHNDGVSASHDIYRGTMDACSPGGLWEIDHHFWRDSMVVNHFYAQNGPMRDTVALWMCQWRIPIPGEIYPEVEAAVIVSPREVPPCDYIPGDINGDEQVRGGDVTYGVRYFKGLGPQPPDSCYHDSIPGTHWLYVAGDANGNCEFRGSDITYLVAYFKGLQPSIRWCRFFPPPGGPGGPAIVRPWQEATEPARVIPTQPR